MYDEVPKNIIAIAIKTKNLNIFLTAFDFIIDLDNNYDSISSTLMDKMISKFFEFDVDCYIPQKIADYLGDKINYSEFYKRWLERNQPSDQQHFNLQDINQVFSLSINTENLNIETDEVGASHFRPEYKCLVM